LSLGVTPQITPNDKIMLDLKIIQDSVAELTDSGPAIDSTKIDTQVLANNGETIVLGGIFKSDAVTSEDKTPLLGDIPFLGRLFKRTSTTNEKSELIIFITPKIVSSEIIPSEE
jgi:type IV pilus assembly protein PilQ